MSSQASVATPARTLSYRIAVLTAVLLPSVTALASASRWAARNPLPFAESSLDPSLLALLVLASALVPAAAVARSGSAVGLAIAVVGSQVPFWAAWPGLPDALRAAALAASPVTIAGIAASVCRSAERPATWTLRASNVLVALAVAVHLLGYDPFADPGCARTCGDVAAPLEIMLGAKDAVRIVIALTLLAVALGAAAVLQSGAPVLLTGAGLAALSLLSGLTLLRWLAWGDATVTSWLVVLGPIAPGIVGGAVCVSALRTARSRSAVTRLVHSLSSPDQTLRVAYAIPGSERWVDALGRDAPAQGAGVVLSDESGPALRIQPPAGTDGTKLLADLTPAERLALRNAQLSAAAAARLSDLRASQRRIMTTSDSERRRIQRDLHDGAQQRLVSALVQLQLAASGLTSTDQKALLDTELRLRTVLSHLRRLDLDPFPETLTSEGLEAALDELADNSNAPVELHASINPVSDDIARAIYALAAAAVDLAARGSPTAQVAIDVWEQERSVHVRAKLAGITEVPSAAFVEVTDRVGAVGGQVTISPAASGATLVQAVIPCGS